MRILVVHNQLWAHYKSKLFSEIHNILRADYPGATFKVVHIAEYETSRAAMKDNEQVVYKYPHEVLFPGNLDTVGFSERLKALFRAYNAFQPTILNITGYFDWAQILLMIYARTKGVRVVLSTESSGMDRRRSGAKEWVKSRIVNQANAYFCFGSSTVEYLLSLGVENSKIAVRKAAVIDEEVILESFRKGQLQKSGRAGLPTHSFIFVGRLAPEKNLLMLLKAFNSLQKRISTAQNWGLIFVGEGPEKENLERFAADNNLSQVRFTGGYPWHQVPQWLALSDVFVLPSVSEPWGLVVNEAMVCGLPVVVSNRCGCAADLVQEGVNGYTFNPDSQQELEETMFFYIENPSQLKPMGDQSRKLIAQFSSAKVAREMVHTFHNLSTIN